MKQLFLTLVLSMALTACKTTNPYEEFRQGYEVAARKPVAKFNAKERATYWAALRRFHEVEMTEMRTRHAEDAADRRVAAVRREVSAGAQRPAPTYRALPDGQGGFILVPSPDY